MSSVAGCCFPTLEKGISFGEETQTFESLSQFQQVHVSSLIMMSMYDPHTRILRDGFFVSAGVKVF